MKEKEKRGGGGRSSLQTGTRSPKERAVEQARFFTTILQLELGCFSPTLGLCIRGTMGFPCGSAGKDSACNVGTLGSIPGLGRSPGGGRGSPVWYSCFPVSSVGQESTCNSGDPSSFPGSGRSAGEGIGYPLQYSWASLVAQLVKTLPAMWEIWIQSLGCKDPPEKGKATHTVFWPGEFHGLYPRGRRESHRTEQLSLSQSLDPFLIQSLWYRPDVHK